MANNHGTRKKRSEKEEEKALRANKIILLRREGGKMASNMIYTAAMKMLQSACEHAWTRSAAASCILF